ncbi:cytochrome P450 [Halopolyspora algeriensis]|uniref:Cytochrome P450 n=1 Tax=Halopolyspora algeriensis TaxID=1500506 RepID=A0A368VP31_9ACTN|nr:cytochrome P450 [Halopolyspora algeriensis]RCW43254.1 cytochrome P450 [Halopolyspora algeriensis]TQM56313.1 cytochrome P450 [Halopolyspora algeriensis]
MSTTRRCPHAETPVLDDEFVQDPHVRYAHMRADAPAQRVLTVTGMPVWVITRYAEARAALADSRFSKDFRRMGAVMDGHAQQGKPRPEFADSIQAHMLNMDPPDHTRLRKLVMKAFTARRVEALRPRIEEITAELLEAMAAKASDMSDVDLLDEFAFPLPIRVICELLGVPEERRDEFRTWSNSLVGGDPESARQAAGAMSTYLVELIARKRREPADDLLTALIEASEDSDRLGEQELVGMVFLLLVAGHETTVNLIGNGVLALLRNPDQLAAVRADPARVSDVVEETLRYDGPVNLATLRFTAEAVTMGDVEIPEGELVLVSLSSANRDEDKYAGAQEFDLDRSTSGHLAFGHGIHFCVGAPLARLEGQVAVRRLIERFPNLSPAAPHDDVRWRFSTLMRGLETLPVRLN